VRSTHTVAPPLAASADGAWRQQPERGSGLLLRWMAFVSLRAGRPFGRIILRLIASYYFLFAPRARRFMRRYLRRALGREPRAGDRFRHILSFATSIHDRVYLLAGRSELFEVTVHGEPQMRAVLARGCGAVLLGAHVGSFEIVRIVGALRAGVNVTMAMYPDNARKLNAMLQAIAAPNPPEFIAVGQLDSMLRTRERLDQGALIGMLADRRLDEDEASMPVIFLGATARFPLGPMRIAAALRAPVVFICGLYQGGNRYHLVFEPLADFSAIDRSERAAAIDSAVRRYVELLERCCRSDPYNWYNFYDFWEEGEHPSALNTAAGSNRSA
jgi:predicted LPLAT superfamily acyltransferase